MRGYCIHIHISVEAPVNQFVVRGENALVIEDADSGQF